MKDVGGGKTFFTFGSVVTAVGQDGYDLVIEVILCLIRT